MNKLLNGDLELDFPVGLAPLAGASDMTFRTLCRAHGAGFAVSEMVSAQAINYHNRNTVQLLRTCEQERPVGIQLFGSDPEAVAKAGRAIEDLPFDFYDFNMGCPVPKVVKNGEGSALMKNPSLAGEIIAALTEAVHKPVTVKIRAGFDENSRNAPEVAKVLEQAGAAAVAVHGRTREQYYAGKADWGIIRQVKESVGIPVIGNGDVTDGPSALALLEETGCDGILIGRAALGNPWIFNEVRHFLETGEVLQRPATGEIRDTLIAHARALTEEKGELTAIRQMRTHAAWYVTGMHNASKFRKAVCQAVTLAEFEQLVQGLS